MAYNQVQSHFSDKLLLNIGHIRRDPQFLFQLGWNYVLELLRKFFVGILVAIDEVWEVWYIFVVQKLQVEINNLAIHGLVLRSNFVGSDWHGMINSLLVTVLQLGLFKQTSWLSATIRLFGMLLVYVLLQVPILVIVSQSVHCLHFCVLRLVVEVVFNHFLRQFFRESHRRLVIQHRYLSLKYFLLLAHVWHSPGLLILVRPRLVTAI